MEYKYEKCVVMYPHDYIEKLKEGYIFVQPNGRAHFKDLFEKIEQRQNEHIEVKFAYAYMLFNKDREGAREESISIIRELSSKGHLPAMSAYSLMLFNGEYVEKDEKQARELLDKCIERDFAVAMDNKAIMLMKGEFGYERNLNEALTYAKRASELGYNMATYRVGRIYSIKRPCLTNLLNAVKYFEMADMSAFPDVILNMLGEAYRKLGKGYTYGRYGIPINEEKGKEYLDKALNVFEKTKKRTQNQGTI